MSFYRQWEQQYESDVDSDIESKEIDYPDEPETDDFYRHENIYSTCDNFYIDYTTLPNIKTVKSGITISIQSFNDCAICLEKCTNQDKGMSYCSLRCGNLFHTKCILKYIKSVKGINITCPFCRVVGLFYSTL